MTTATFVVLAIAIAYLGSAPRSWARRAALALALRYRTALGLRDDRR